MTLSKEDKRQLKSERVKKVFALTARDMIHEEGITSVTVRKVAERAGYSLGTVYNHFKNIDELLWMTRDYMIREIADLLTKQAPKVESVESLAEIMVQYADYYRLNPNVFRFFYFHHLNQEDNHTSSVIQEDAHQKQTQETITLISRIKSCEPAEAVLTYKTIIYAVHGMLMMFISDNDGISDENMSEEISRLITMIMSS